MIIFFEFDILKRYFKYLRSQARQTVGLITGCLLLLFFLQGCGQSKVDYKKVDLIQGSPTLISPLGNPGSSSHTPDESTNPTGDTLPNPTNKPLIDPEKIPRLDPEIHPLLKEKIKISFGAYSTLDFDHLEQWQKWYTPKERTLSLNILETNGLGDFLAATPVTWDEKSYTLNSISVDRCVFRNRLLEKLSTTQGLDMEDEEKQLPPPFGNLKLFCVKTTSGIKSKVEFAISKDEDEIALRWVGTSAVKFVPRHGKQIVEFKLTSRVAQGVVLPAEAQNLLTDDFDKLLNVSMPNSDSSNCGLERTYFLKIELNEGALVGAKMIVKSRHLSKPQMAEFAQIAGYGSPVLYWHTDPRIPPINVSAIHSCQFQHAAWAYCSVGSILEGSNNVECDPEVSKLLGRNFADLLESDTPGFATNKVFTYTRSQANGDLGIGNLQLWHDPEARGTNKIKYNPLSLEDFQEFTDIVELVP